MVWSALTRMVTWLCWRPHGVERSTSAARSGVAVVMLMIVPSEPLTVQDCRVFALRAMVSCPYAGRGSPCNPGASTQSRSLAHNVILRRVHNPVHSRMPDDHANRGSRLALIPDGAIVHPLLANEDLDNVIRLDR